MSPIATLSIEAPSPENVLVLQQVSAWLQQQVPGSAGLRRLVDDSRALQSGDVFFAYPGRRVDGRQYLAQASAADVAAVVYEAEGVDSAYLQQLAPGVPRLAITGLRDCLGWIAARYYDFPTDHVQVIAVTGTNGKTSCTQWIAQALAALGKPCGVIGTLGVSLYSMTGMHPSPSVVPGDKPLLTTPSALDLQYAMAWLRLQGVQYAAIEASSIGLSQGRLQGCHVDTAAWTNLSHDHLDYHENMQAYEAAKRLLFHMPGLRHVVINADDAAGQRLTAALLQKTLEQPTLAAPPPAVEIISVSTSGAEATLCTDSIRYGCDAADRANFGMSLSLRYQDRRQSFCVPVLGRFNADNLLIVLGVLLAQGISFDQALQGMQSIVPVPGRMECLIADPAAPLAIIDYAHTPDALQQVLQALRTVAQARSGRLVCVFGCGGERDVAKRADMGRIAEAAADEIWLTSDNPRSEPPEAILQQIVSGLQRPERAFIEISRAQAIAHALSVADARDVVLIAGKGHESFQEIAGKRYEFSDSAHALTALRARVALPVGAAAGSAFPALRRAYQ